MIHRKRGADICLRPLYDWRVMQGRSAPKRMKIDRIFYSGEKNLLNGAVLVKKAKMEFIICSKSMSNHSLKS